MPSLFTLFIAFLHIFPHVSSTTQHVISADVFSAAAEFSAESLIQSQHSREGLQADSLTELHVFVCHYALHGGAGHYSEVEAAIAANLVNPAITSLQILYEPSQLAHSRDGCAEVSARLEALLVAHWPSASPDGDSSINKLMAARLKCLEVPTGGKASAQEVVALYPSLLHGPTLKAAAPNTKVVVVVINGDVVLDQSSSRLKSLQWGHVAALTVNSGPRMEHCCLGATSPLHESVIAEEGKAMGYLQKAKAAASRGDESLLAAAYAGLAPRSCVQRRRRRVMTSMEGGTQRSLGGVSRNESAISSVTGSASRSGGSSSGSGGGESSCLRVPEEDSEGEAHLNKLRRFYLATQAHRLGLKEHKDSSLWDANRCSNLHWSR
jgi:hypothetical protein